jgi:hypothetical protein
MVTQASLVGQTLGGFAVEALLGSGGMASVYRGLDLQLQRPVAIKVLTAHTAALPGFAERFRQEARLAASLRHPNIVQVFAFGEERGMTYMVQELLPGPTLEQRMADVSREGGFLGAGEVVAIVAQLAAALDAAHAAGVIHRDVKPANALWNGAGALVLTDFGIAKALSGAVTQTQAGTIMGTPTYMAPEQAQGLPLSPATDSYALGVILYQLLTGQVPFAAGDAIALLLQHIQEPPQPPSVLRPDLPPAVEDVVMRALAKEPGRRYSTAGALAEALRQAWPTAAAAGDIHQAPTRRWAPSTPTPAPAAAYVPPAAAYQPQTAPAPEQAQAAPYQPPVAPAPAPRHRRGLLPMLGALLALAFLAAALLAARGQGDEGRAAATAPAATPAAALTPAPGGPVAEVRELLAAGARDGRAGPQGEALVAAADAAGQALALGDAGGATAQLAALQRALLQEARAGALDPNLLREALSGIDAIADEHGLELPLNVS